MTSALTVQNSAGSALMSISNDAANSILNVTGSNYGQIRLNQTTANRFVSLTSTGTSAEFYVGSAVTNYLFTNNGGYSLLKINTAPLPNAGGSIVEIPNSEFIPTSGSASLTSLLINTRINQTGGANGVTRGLYVNPTLTAAADWRSIEWSNNSGWGLYGAGTADNYLAGRLGIGSTSTNASLNVFRNITGSSLQYGVWSHGFVQSDVTLLAANYTSSTRVSNTIFTLPDFVGYYATQVSIGASATVTRQTGFLADSNLTGGVSNYGFQGAIPNGTNRWNLYMAGTADNYLRGKLLINTTSVETFALDVNGTARVSGAITGGATLTVNGAITCGGLATNLTSNGLEVASSADLRIQQNNTSAGGHRFIINQGGTLKDVFKIFRSTNVLIQDGGTFTDTASSQLTINSSTKGFLPPRMTTTEKNAIGTPAAGLQVYDTTLNQMSYYNGTTWIQGGGTVTDSFGVTLDGQGGVISTGSKGFVTIPYNCTITDWYLSANIIGSMVIDIKRAGTSIIGAGNKPTLTSAISGNAAVSGWTSVAIVAGDIIEWNVDSASTISNVTLTIKVNK